MTSVRRIPRDSLIEFMESYDIPLERLRRFEMFRIFVVDDEPDQIDIIRRAIKGIEGEFVVESATSGYEAILRIGTFSPDLVTLDLKMPGMDGFELCRALRNVSETRRTRILAITGYPTEENIARAKEAGVNDWLAKPVDVAKLREKVADLLDTDYIVGEAN